MSRRSVLFISCLITFYHAWCAFPSTDSYRYRRFLYINPSLFSGSFNLFSEYKHTYCLVFFGSLPSVRLCLYYLFLLLPSLFSFQLKKERDFVFRVVLLLCNNFTVNLGTFLIPDKFLFVHFLHLHSSFLYFFHTKSHCRFLYNGPLRYLNI